MQTIASEAKQLTKIAIPLILAQLFLMAIGLTDVLIAGWAGTSELAGMMIANNVTQLIIFFFFGIGIAAQPLVGHCYGEGSRIKMRREIQQLLWTSLFAGAIAVATLYIAYIIIGYLDYQQPMKSVAVSYLLVMLGSALAFPILGAVRGSLDGMKQSNKMLPIYLIAFIINIPLDYLLVFGLYGLPKLGAVGCAISTVTIHWAMVLSGLWILKYHHHNKPLRLFNHFFKPDAFSIKRIIKIGLPIGGSISAEMTFFAMVGIMLAFLGEIVAASHSIAIGVAGFFYMAYLGIGQAITVRASNLIGAKQHQQAWFSCKLGIALGLLVALVPMLLTLLYKTDIAKLFNNDSQVIALTSILLTWSIAFQLGDSLQATVLCALRAYRDTLSALRYQIIVFWFIAFPTGYFLLKTNWLPFATGASAYWFAMIVGLSLVGITLWFKLIRVAHKHQ